METKKKIENAVVATGVSTTKIAVLNTKNIEEAKIETKQPKGLNLDETIKVIEDLFQKKRYRDRLDTYINFLDAFEIKATQEDLDPKQSNYYGCKLVLTDDNRANFEMKNPTILKEVIDFLKSRFGAKLGEIEAELVLPTL